MLALATLSEDVDGSLGSPKFLKRPDDLQCCLRVRVKDRLDERHDSPADSSTWQAPRQHGIRTLHSGSLSASHRLAKASSPPSWLRPCTAVRRMSQSGIAKRLLKVGLCHLLANLDKRFQCLEPDLLVRVVQQTAQRLKQRLIGESERLPEPLTVGQVGRGPSGL
jgi:hypothetical protein